MKHAIALTCAALLLLAGCSDDGSSDAASREDLEATFDDFGAEAAECIAGELIDAGMTQAQLDEMKDWDGTNPEPAALGTYRDARDSCIDDPTDEAVDAILEAGS